MVRSEVKAGARLQNFAPGSISNLRPGVAAKEGSYLNVLKLYANSIGAAPLLAREPRILDKVAETLGGAGLVGEDRAVKLLYLVMTSRYLNRPVSAVVKGPSSAGKSHTTSRVLSLFPKSAYHEISAMSEKALVYSKEPLEHRMLVVYESAGLSGDIATYLMRSLLSEGCIRYETVISTPKGLEPRQIYRPGPTGLITTTTKLSLHPENETRLISIPVNDTADQTAAVMLAAAEGKGSRLDTLPWHEFQEWLHARVRGVFIPFAPALARLIPPVAVRLRRDFPALLALIEVHALLHQASRDRDGKGNVVATTDDYEAVRELVDDLLSEGVATSVRPTVRQTVETVAAMEPNLFGHPLRPITEALQLDKSAASRRVRDAVRDGYLKNLEERYGKPMRIVLGEPLPDDVRLLPSKERLDDDDCCAVA